MPRHPSPTLRFAPRHPPSKEDEIEEESDVFVVEESDDEEDVDCTVDQDISDAVTAVAPTPTKKRAKKALVPTIPKKARSSKRAHRAKK